MQEGACTKRAAPKVFFITQASTASPFSSLNPDCAAIVLTGSSFGTREIAVTGLPFFHYEGGVFETADGDHTYSFRFFSKDGEEL